MTRVGAGTMALALVAGPTALAQVAGALGPETIMRRALTGNTCGAVGEACMADPDCYPCLEVFLGADETCQGPDFDFTTATCSEIFEGLCCAIDLAEGVAGCASNDLWLAFYDCENTECGHSANDCSDAVDPSTVVTTGSTTTDSETSTSASTNTCGADGEACGADIVCDQCAQIFLGADETCRDPGFDRTTATCSEIFEGFCCAIELAEDAGCATNDLWLALYECENTECGHAAIDCPGAVDPSTVVTTGSTTTDSETSTSTSTNTCGADGEACGADIVCDQCAQIFLGADETCRDPGFDRTTATCSEIFEGFCCAIELAEDAGCATNDLWLALYECEDTQCGHSAIECPGAVDPSTVTTGSTTTSATTCDIDLDACIADSDCTACYDAFWGSADGCGYDEFSYDYSYGYGTPGCKEDLESLCCAIEAAEEVAGCSTNDLWLASYGCEDPECGHSANDCPNAVDATNTATEV